MQTKTPIHTIPIEILTDIFDYALISKKVKRNTDPWIRECKDPRDITRLSQVCSHWRHIALSTSRLWTSLRLVWSNAFTEWSSQYQQLKELITVQSLSHSKGHPLDLDIHVDNLPSHQAAFAVVKSILSYASRLRNLRLYMTLPQDLTVHSLFSSVESGIQFPLLEKLHLRIWSEDNDLVVFPPTFAHSPKLTSLTLEHGFSRVCITPDAFSWSQIQHLNIQGMLSSTDYHHILRHSPSLLSANLTLFIHPSRLNIPDFTHPTLSSLTLHISNCNANPLIGPTLFSSLTLPSLRSFKCHKLCDPDFYTPLFSFTSLLQRSRCTLEELSVDFDDISDAENIADLVGSAPDLRALDIMFTCPITKEVLPDSQLVVRHPDINILPQTLIDKEGMWPKLRTLKLAGGMDPSVVLSLLDRRARQLVEVDLTMNWDESVVGRIEELNMSGCDASFDELEEILDDHLFELW